MMGNSEEKYILMSLREQYFKDMITGKKKYEYRKKYQKVPTKAYIYISKTEKKIKAIIEFDKPIVSDNKTISSIAERDIPGSYNNMMEYLDNGIGYAIPIKRIIIIDEVSLAELKFKFTNFVVPQSYYILNKKKDVLDFLNKRAHLKIYDFS